MALEVELKVFDGPLDLLLSLIEKNKINIFDIPIAEITAQYLEYVRNMREESLDVMSEFTVMAAELIAIKCRMLLPKQEDSAEDEGDPREELVRRLLEYKTFRYMAGELRNCMEEVSGRVFKDDTTPEEVRKFRPEIDPSEVVGDITLAKLRKIFESVVLRQADKIDPIRSRFGRIEREDVSLPDTLDNVAGYAKKHRKFSFRELLTSRKSRMEIVVTFLAVLELISIGCVRAVQEGMDDDIEIENVPGADFSSIREKIRESGFSEGEEDHED